ncbi:MAG TPA: sigma-70 family RNA polymerase sigma factor [Chitinophagaceae bacterium]|nr:sigma-70 family RNA polymerase sigma factor [Chitinophagaceae bacterium]
MKNTFSFCSDEQLIQIFQEDNQEIAFQVLLERHKNAIYTNIYFTVRNTEVAEDIFQDTFIRIFNHLKKKKYQEQGKFLPWAQRIASNLCIDYFRKLKNTRRYLVSNGEELLTFVSLRDSKNKEAELIEAETSVIVSHLIEQLPAEQREVIILRIYAELSFKEIAQMTNVSINTALGRMRYGLQNLRKSIQNQQVAVR